MIRRPPRSTLSSSSAASDVYKRQFLGSTNKLFDQALSYTDISPDLALRIRVSNSTYTINFGVKLRDKIHTFTAVSYTHLRAHETKANLVCRLLLEKKKKKKENKKK